MFDVNHIRQAYSVIVESRRGVKAQGRFVEIVYKILKINHAADTGFEVEGTPQRTDAVSKEGQEVFQVETAGIAAAGAAEFEKVGNCL
jgi:hypothetical protein